tara:strand:- start:310 stop:1065 length:756 start_codon:yes stop_codon:yes gene_type:complete
MDKSIFTALNSMQILKNNQSVVSQNLSNTNVVGYKKDIQANFGSVYLDREKGIDPRVFAFSDVGAFDNSQGPLNPSERKLDLAIDGDGYFIVKPDGGKLALSRRGDLKVGIDGTLRDNAGAQIFSVDLEPIEIPPYRNISIANDGIITIEPLNAEPGEQVVVGQIASTKGSEEVKLVKSLDGFIRTEDGGVPEPDQQSRIVSGFLEGSNVKSVDELVSGIEQSRSYEINVKFITTAKELDEAGSSLMRMPN